MIIDFFEESREYAKDIKLSESHKYNINQDEKLRIYLEDKNKNKGDEPKYDTILTNGRKMAFYGFLELSEIQFQQLKSKTITDKKNCYAI